MRPHGNARANRRRPRAWAICDDCGFLYNKSELQWQYEWQGARTQNTNMLKCDRCIDDLQEQNRVIVLPADPQPVSNPRPENYAYADNQIATIGTNVGTMTQAAGLASAFDANTNKGFAFSAVVYNSAVGLNNWIGKYWAGLDPNNPTQGPTAVRFVVNAPNDAKFAAAGAVAYQFQGSNFLAGFVTLASGITAGTIGEIIDVTITPTTGYLYHRFIITGDGTSSVSVAQLQIYKAA